MKLLWIIIVSFLFVGCDSAASSSGQASAVPSAKVSATPTAAPSTAPAGEIPVWTYEIINTYPHDSSSYTQGLIYRDDVLYESAGQYKESSLRKVDLKTGKVLKKIPVPGQYFAEGMTIFMGKVFQLTWREEKVFVYEPDTFRKTGEFTYEGEGWGLTHDGQQLIMSDGSSQIRFINADTFKVERRINVTLKGRPVEELNELEYIKGEIYANIYQTDRIVRIDPKTGQVLGVIDMTGILPGKPPDEMDNVLNGIAYDEKGERLFITGKRWPKLFEVRLKVK
jgi:glutamine cyclotransferase